MAQGPKDQKSSLGIIALQRKLIDQKQLMECLNLQRAAGPDASLEQILIKKGYLTKKQILALGESLKGATKPVTRKKSPAKKAPTAEKRVTAPKTASARGARTRKQPTGVYPVKTEVRSPSKKRVHRATEIRPAVSATKTRKSATRATSQKRPPLEEVPQTGRNRTLLL